jgi:mannose-1-phosphate guanylyltransferase/mannose-6-phosphate isomerase
MIDYCWDSLEMAREDLDFLRLDEAAYARCPDISLDYAIMEKTENIACVPLKCDWNDLGSWNAVAECLEKDVSGNARHGDVLFVESCNCLGYSEDDVHVALLGLEDAIVVATRDAVLVASRQSVQDVRKVVEKLRKKNPPLVTSHKRVYRPWGWYEGLAREGRFQVKRIMVKPGEQLSLQSHFHRAEHWVVVSGTAKVMVGDRTTLLTEGESIYIPLGEKHRLENPGCIPLCLIEVQVGGYLGEDDIVRYEDKYNR